MITMVIGESYKENWEKYCQKNWQIYCRQHSIDLITIDKLIDDKFQCDRSPAWQKCLILEDPRVKDYDQVMWIDSDILINPTAPNIFENIPLDKISGVKGFEQLSNEEGVFSEEMLAYIKTPYDCPKKWYELNHLSPSYDVVFQTGVMIFSPKHHRDFLKSIFYKEVDSKTGDYEMPYLSHAILEQGLEHWIDVRFNKLWTGEMVLKHTECLPPEKKDGLFKRKWKHYTRGHYQFPPKNVLRSCLEESFKNSYFLHFAGNAHFMTAIDFNDIYGEKY